LHEINALGDELSSLKHWRLERLLGRFPDATFAIAMASCAAFGSKPKKQGKSYRHSWKLPDFEAR